MAAWTEDTRKASYGNFNKYIVDKIKSAAKMSAEERKARKELDPDIKTAKGYYFGKALSAEFGGDLIRRTRGTFSKDPTSAEDPSLSKGQRFSNLISGDIASVHPSSQLELPLDVPENKSAVQVEDKSMKSWLSAMILGLEKTNKEISSKFSNLLAQEKTGVSSEDNQNKSFNALFASIKTLKNYFNKDNKLSEVENEIEEKQLELILDAKDDSEMVQRESDLESTQNVSRLEDTNDVSEKESKDGGGGSIFDMFDIDFPGRRRRRRGSRRRLARRRFNRFRGGLGRRFRGLGGSGGGLSRGLGGLGRGFGGFARGLGGISKGLGGRFLGPILGDMIFPEGAGSSEPQMGPDGVFRSPNGSQPPTRKLSEGGYSPKSIEVAKPNRKKLSEGGVFDIKNPKKLANGGFNTGVYDNPTTGSLLPGQSVIPLNRNNPVSSIFKQMDDKKSVGQSTPTGIKLADPLSKVIQLPVQATGGLVISFLSEVMQRLGGMGRFMYPIIEKTFKPIARVFGLPPGVISSVFSGVSDLSSGKTLVDFLSKGLGIGGKGGRKKNNNTTPNPTPSPGGQFGPGMTASGGSMANPGDIISGFKPANRPNHMGIDISGGAWRKGTPISVIKPGVVKYAGWQNESDHKEGWGQYVVIAHDDGSSSLYGHLDEINVRSGQRIENKSGAATVIGKLGNTGRSTGPHLHFELGTGVGGDGRVLTGHTDPSGYINNYARAGGDVKIDAPQVSAPGQQPAQQPGTARPSPATSPTSVMQSFADQLNPLGNGMLNNPLLRGLNDAVKGIFEISSSNSGGSQGTKQDVGSNLALSNGVSPSYHSYSLG